MCDVINGRYVYIFTRLLCSEDSIPFSDFTESTKKVLEALSSESVGPIKVVYESNGSPILEYLGFVGQFRILLDTTKHHRHHGFLILGEKKLSHDMVENE
jgi:hypothetical protein